MDINIENIVKLAKNNPCVVERGEKYFEEGFRKSHPTKYIIKTNNGELYFFSTGYYHQGDNMFLDFYVKKEDQVYSYNLTLGNKDHIFELLNACRKEQMQKRLELERQKTEIFTQLFN